MVMVNHRPVVGGSNELHSIICINDNDNAGPKKLCKRPRMSWATDNATLIVPKTEYYVNVRLKSIARTRHGTSL